jgi:cyclopropane fatty-acyl-phospholipid synthase-like methyltransferase
MRPMTAADFEARYRADQDPWGYRVRTYEREKYQATLEACGPGDFASALELGASIGVFSALLAPRCHALTTIDLAPSAVAAARDRLASHPHARPLLGTLPQDLPEGAYDLVVASEILYYLTEADLRETLARLEEVMLPDARLVAVHWRPAGPDRWLDAAKVHGLLRAQPWLEQVRSGGTDEYRLDVFRRL